MDDLSCVVYAQYKIGLLAMILFVCQAFKSPTCTWIIWTDLRKHYYDSIIVPNI